jgi:hypothetical protein
MEEKDMHFVRRSRRHFLVGAGSLLALPLMRSLLPFDLEKLADAAPSPKAFIGIAAQNGMFNMYGPQSILMPAAPEQNGALVGFQQTVIPGKHTIHSKSLASAAAANGGKVSDVIDASFTPYLAKMAMLQGFDYVGMGSAFHHTGHFGDWAQVATHSSGNQEMATLDLVLADHYKKLGLPSDVVAYTASYRQVSDNFGGSLTSFRADGTRTPTCWNPATLWDKYFATTKIPADARVMLVDRILEDYKSVRNNPRLGAEDRARLDAHVAHLAETEAKVKQVAAVCKQLRPDQNLTDRQLIATTMNSVIVGLISCGMCNLFTGIAGDLVNEDPGQWHTWSHEGFNATTMTVANQTSYNNLVEQNRRMLKDACLDLAQKLDQVGQLDSSLIVWIMEHSKRGHETWNVPAILFGSAGGVFKTNQYIDYRRIDERDDEAGYTRYGYPMNQLYSNILRAFGMAPSDYEPLNQPGSPDHAGHAYRNIFKPNSGYGISALAPSLAFKYSYPGLDYTQPGVGATHYAGWQGYDLSSPLPLATTLT